MIEIRRVVWGQQFRLQYRFFVPSVDASGAFCPPGEMSEWKDVEDIDVNDVALEDLRATGGIMDAP